MSEIINELAKIDITDEVLKQLDVQGIYRSLSSNFLKLDDLKNFRSEFEKQSKLMRWWHSDKLQDAQLDSVEVQSEFSKAIGQLMMISILQSKKLQEQQTLLNEQQSDLMAQAKGIATQANELQKQHHVLAEQSAELENLVHEYFELKGLTEEGAQKLIDIAREVKATKQDMIQDFTTSSKDLEALCADVTYRMTLLSEQVNDQIQQSLNQTQSAISTLQQESHAVAAAAQSGLRDLEINLLARDALLESSLSSVSTKLAHHEEAYAQKLKLIESELSGQVSLLATVASEIPKNKIELIEHIQKMQIAQDRLSLSNIEASKQIKRNNYAVIGLAIFSLAMMGGLAHLLQWF